MKLPNDCPFSKMSQGRFYNDRMDCCGGYLIAAGEPPLCQARDTEREVYRFTWRSSFDGNALVHIASTDSGVRLRSRLFGYLAPSVPSASLMLAPHDWDTLQRALEASDFWALDTQDKRIGMDGAQWLIEGRRGDTYHSIRRWNSLGAVGDLGRLFFALAGPPLAHIELY